MKNQVILSGSIAKKETLVPIEANILENTFVTEAASPYANYYGSLPQKPKPNSLFFHTQKFFFLEEILSFSKHLEKYLLEKINIASSYIEYNNKQYPAIRIKNFPDYSQLAVLQQCLILQDVELTPRLNIKGEVKVRINKLFDLNKIETDIYMDINEENKGYIMLEQKILPENFDEVTSKVKNNTECKLFDVVQGEVLMNGEVREIIRIFAEGLDVQLLKCLKNRFKKLG